MIDQIDKHKQLATKLVENSSVSERVALHIWAGSLIELRERDMPVLAKAKEAVGITLKAKLVWPVLKAVSRQIKQHGWENRTISQRFGIATAGTAFAVFGGSNAGIAALGGAVAVPLWVVFGAGAMFARHLYEQLDTIDKNDRPEAHKVDDERS